MADEIMLNGLLVTTLLLSLVLIIVSSAALGRKLADLEIQVEKGIQGAPRIQSIVNLRVHMNRLLLGLCFFLIPVLLLADSPLLWRTWVNRILFLVMLSSYSISSVLDWLDERKQVRLLIAEEDALHEKLVRQAAEAEAHRDADVLADRDSYRQMAEEAIGRLEQAVKDGVPSGQVVLPVLVPVVPEHSSPATPEQLAVAGRQTMRARLVAAAVSAGQQPRENPSEPPVPDPMESVDVATIQPEAIQAITDAVRHGQDGQDGQDDQSRRHRS
jgi:hypothetical protein